MKISKDPLYDMFNIPFYWFKNTSPYVKKIEKIMRRIDEGNLLYIPSLIYENRVVFETDKRNKLVKKIKVNLQNLMHIIFIGLSLASGTFIIEMILSLLGKVDKNFLKNRYAIF